MEVEVRFMFNSVLRCKEFGRAAVAHTFNLSGIEASLEEKKNFYTFRNPHTFLLTSQCPELTPVFFTLVGDRLLPRDWEF